jgi:hypothetical protein
MLGLCFWKTVLFLSPDGELLEIGFTQWQPMN